MHSQMFSKEIAGKARHLIFIFEELGVRNFYDIIQAEPEWRDNSYELFLAFEFISNLWPNRESVSYIKKALSLFVTKKITKIK